MPATPVWTLNPDDPNPETIRQAASLIVAGELVAFPTETVYGLGGFFASGAYSFAASPLLFLSHDTPIELLKLGGNVAVARERMPATRFW